MKTNTGNVPTTC